MLKDIQHGEARLARVHVPRVFARPPERLAFHALHPVGIDLARFPEIEFRHGKIISHDADKFHWREKAGAQGCIRRRAA